MSLPVTSEHDAWLALAPEDAIDPSRPIVDAHHHLWTHVEPPYLLDEPQRFNRRELFWIVQNGIKMTGMPSWRQSMSDRQIWDVVAWLEASPKLPPQTYVAWRRGGRCRG